ncbi:hypothetical protein NPIL_377611 [Nephila pilipes]|uniref:Uncharacterized protein n=1 Tax=Nephila pilipes TaxID=299642 RepID=A0A8X6ITK5_NEPPI|nr:hypothetical protein NPIL_377611 [Nephila pilipes]
MGKPPFVVVIWWRNFLCRNSLSVVPKRGWFLIDIEIMDVRFVLAIFASLLYVSISVADDSTNDQSQKKLYAVLTCVAKSGDQALCDEFLKCLNELPKSVNGAVNECMDKIPDGKTCSKDKELFNSEKDRNQVLKCIKDQLRTKLSPLLVMKLSKTKKCFKGVDQKCTKKVA